MSDSSAPAVPIAVERFIKQLVITFKAVQLYPLASSIPKENATEAVRILDEFLQNHAEMRFVIQKPGLVYEGSVVFEGRPAYETFAQDLYNRALAEVRFHVGVDPSHLTAFLGILKATPADLAAAGGFENRLWESGVDTISVKQAAARIVDTDTASDVETDEEWPPDSASINEIVAAALGGRPRDQRLLVRVVADVETFTNYLQETFCGRGVDPAKAVHDIKIAEIARIAAEYDTEARHLSYSALAQAIGALDPDVRHRLLTERLLPESRSDEHLADIVRHMDIDELCHWLAEDVSDDKYSVDGLARAIRNLAQISLAERETVMNAVGAAMRTGGFAEATIDEVMEAVSPSILQVKEHAAEADRDKPVDSILQLVDLAPGSVAKCFDTDPGFLAIQEESRSGISDGDVVGAFVSLVGLNAQGDNFTAMMDMLEDTLQLTIERGDFDVAADAVEGLTMTAADSELTANRRERILNAVASMAGKQELAVVAKAMRMYQPETPEHQACMRLLEALGTDSIAPLLEVLADEPDMTARKALVDTISAMAGAHVSQLGAHLSDTRWYFVRNVVAILGKTRQPGITTYLNRTLRHGDARVRRETIRALAGVRDPTAREMLIAALDDSDAQNVQLAARYLGAGGVSEAIQVLCQVALGEGRGNRETGPRAEAIEALGHIGDTEALSVLEGLAGKRAVLHGARTRELRTAAKQAIIAMRANTHGSSEGDGDE